MADTLYRIITTIALILTVAATVLCGLMGIWFDDDRWTGTSLVLLLPTFISLGLFAHANS